MTLDVFIEHEYNCENVLCQANQRFTRWNQRNLTLNRLAHRKYQSPYSFAMMDSQRIQETKVNFYGRNT